MKEIKYLVLAILSIVLFSFVLLLKADWIEGQITNTPTSRPSTAVDRISEINLNLGSILSFNNGTTNNVTQYKIGGIPSAIAVNPNTNKVYISNALSNTVSVIDGSTKNITQVEVFDSASAIVVNPNTNDVYVANNISNIMSVINGRTNNVTQFVVAGIPSAIAVNPNTNKVYVSYSNSSTISVIDNDTITPVKLEGFPSAIAVNPNTNKVYVASSQVHRLYLIDGDTNLVDIVSGITFPPLGIVVNPNTNKVYISNALSNTVSVIDGDTKKILTQEEIGYPYRPLLMAINPTINRAYLINQVFVPYGHSNTVFEIDASKISGSTDKPAIKVGSQPHDIAVNPQTNKVYVANSRSNTVSVIDGSTNDIKQVKVGLYPLAIAVNVDTNKVYVANAFSNTVSVIDGDTNNVTEVKVGVYPTTISVNPNINQIYVGNARSNTVSVINGSNAVKEIELVSIPSALSVNPNVNSNKIYLDNNIPNTNAPTVGDTSNAKQGNVRPALSAIAVNPNTNKVYVANGLSNTISVIQVNPENYNVTQLKVGFGPFESGPFRPAIAVNPNTNKVYVSYSNSSTISVIDNDTITPVKLEGFPLAGPSGMAVNTKTDLVYISTFDSVNIVDDHTVGYSFEYTIKTISTHPGLPTAVTVNPNTNKVYVAHLGSNTVSVIDGDTNNVTEVEVGNFPSAIAVNPNTNKVYVANGISNTVSVIDGDTNNLVAGIIFDISPSNSGHIECNKQERPTKQYVYIEVGTRCTAEPNKGFLFSNWIENLGHRSTKTISTSTISSDSPYNSFLSILGLFHPNDNAAELKITQYGNFTANYKEISPPVPPEYWIPLYGIIVSSIVGWSIPSIIALIRTKNQERRLNYYHKRIKFLFDDGKLDETDIEPLNKLSNDMTDAYARGKMDDEHYKNLKDEISVLYEEVYKKRIDLLNSLTNKDDRIVLEKIKSDMRDAYAKRKISVLHYKLLNNMVSDYEDSHNMNKEP